MSPTTTGSASPPSSRLSPQLHQHRSRQLNTVHLDATGRERQGNATGTNCELEHTPPTGLIHEKVDDRIDHFRSALSAEGCAVARRDERIKQAVGWVISHRADSRAQ